MATTPIRYSRSWRCWLLTSVLALSGCASHHNAPAESPEIPETSHTLVSDVRFSPEGWPQALYADLYLPQGVSGPAPVVLMVHGGGWERRSREDMDWLAEEVASRGFAVLNIDYRFAPEYRFPAQLHDLQVARQWLNNHAADYDIDPDRVSGFGFSSGAHLVALLATVASSDNELNQPWGGPATALDAVVAGGTPADLTAFGSGKLLRQFLGGDPDEKPALYRQASPVTHVSEQTPPFFLFHGDLDMLVPFDQARRLKQALASAGVYHEFYEMHLRGHVTSFLTAGTLVDEAVGFLMKQGRN